MGATAADRIAYAQALERRDAEIDVATQLIVRLTTEVVELRSKVAGMQSSFDALPDARDAAEHAQLEAVEAERAAQVTLDEVRARLAQLERSRRHRQDDLDQAHRELRRATEQLDDAGARVERARLRRRQIDDDERALGAAREGATVEARSLAAELMAAPRVPVAGKQLPGGSLEEIEEWCGQARAALFVARGAFDAERERLVLEATALGAAVLGEELGGSSVSVIRQRIEEATHRTESNGP